MSARNGQPPRPLRPHDIGADHASNTQSADASQHWRRRRPPPLLLPLRPLPSSGPPPAGATGADDGHDAGGAGAG